MEVVLRTSTGANIRVWRERDTYTAQRAGIAGEPQTCWGIDLFEVIADLAGLDLERAVHAKEAIALAERAIAELGPDERG